MAKHILITGINGFVGKHLTRELISAGCIVSGASLDKNVAPQIQDLVSSYLPCDLSNKEEVNRLDLSPFDGVISLAGLASVGQSFGQSERYGKINVAVLSNVCSRLIEQGLSPRVIAVSTGAVYENHQAMPLTEESKLISEGSPYALSKIAMEKAAFEALGHGLPQCIVVRPFNHIGPGQEPGFLVPDMYQKIMMALKTDKVLKTGPLSTKRDYTDVRDVVRAYAGLVLSDSNDIVNPVYNICSGRSRSGNEILEEFKKYIPKANTLKTIVDPTLMRKDDPEELVGSNELIKQVIGWRPKIPFEKTIADFVGSKKA